MYKIKQTRKIAVLLFIIFNVLFSFCSSVSADTLKQTLAAAYKNNKSLCIDRVSLHTADESVYIARSGYMPTIGIQGQYAQNNRIDSTSSLGIYLEHKIFDGFITKNYAASATSKAKAQREFVRNSLQNLLLEAVKAYAELYAARKIVVLRQKNISALESQVQAARIQLQVGKGTQTDLAQSKAEFSQAMSLFHQANADVKVKEATYQRIIGIKSGLLEQPNRIKDFPEKLDDGLQYALHNHPAILYAQYNAEAAYYMVKAHQGEHLPQITAKVGTYYSEIYNSRDVHGQSNSVNLQLSIPVFQGGSISAQVRQSQEFARQAQIEVGIKQDQVREQFISYWSNLKGAEAAVTAYKDSVYASQIALDGRMQESRVGQATIFDVLNTRAMVVNSQISLILAERDALIAGYAIKSAMGQLDDIAKL